ncbi:MAG: phosphoenolpyruvate kinase [Candidatus Eisenbacteria bacterium]
MTLSLTESDLKPALERLAAANRDVARRFPGDKDGRQAVHTVYGGAQLFKADTAVRLGVLALRALEEYGPDAVTFGSALGLPGRLVEPVYARVLEKLGREPVEDFRIDYEDGYGNRPDHEEDGHAVSGAEELAQGLAAGTAAAFGGIRIKPLSPELAARSLRTLDLFVTTFVQAHGGRWHEGLVITLPKITHPDQVTVCAEALDALEHRLALKPGSIPLELMIETPQSIFADDGTAAPAGLIAAGRGRVGSAHFGTYDYTASLDITAAHQHMAHPACDFAKDVLKVTLAGTGVRLSDGATNIMPVGPHKALEGSSLTEVQLQDNRRTVHAAWRLHYEHVRHSLETAYYQGWDLHPGQLPTRYAAVYTFFMEGLDAAAERLSNFVGKAAQATLVGDVFDDAATGQGLLNYFLRAINCGAISESEAVERTGLTLEDFQGKSFLAILKRRRG